MFRLIFILIAFGPSLIFLAAFVWLLGHFGFTALQPYAMMIENFFRPAIDFIVQIFHNFMNIR